MVLDIIVLSCVDICCLIKGINLNIVTGVSQTIILIGDNLCMLTC